MRGRGRGVGMRKRMGAAPWTPAALGSSVALRLTAGPTWCFTDAGGTVQAGDGDPVYVWKDRSGNARDVSQSTLSARPVLRLASGRWWYLEFDGIDADMSRANSGIPAVAPIGVFVVARDEDNSATYRLISLDDRWRLGSAGGNGVFTLPGISDYTSSGVVFTGGALTQVSCQFDASFDVTWRRNGGNEEVVAAAADTPNSGTTLVIGSRPTSNDQHWKGRLTEVVVVGAQLTTGQRSSLETYLMSQWGVA